MKHRILQITVVALVLTNCSTTESYTKVDQDAKSVNLYTSMDERTALQNPNNDSNVKATVASLQAEVKKNPKSLTSWVNLANLLVAQNQLNAAEEAARKALRLDIQNIPAKKVLAQVALRRNLYDLALIILNGMGGYNSKDADVINMMALVAIGKNEPARASSLFQRAIKLDPSNVPVRLNLGVAYLRYRMLQPASVQFERVLKVHPENPDALMHLAVIKSARGDHNEAEKIYKSILRRDKENPIALFNMAVLEQRRADFDEAVANLKAYLRTGKGTSKENEEAFALIERIRDRQSQANKKTVTDEEIRVLAAEAKQAESQRKAASSEATLPKPKKPETSKSSQSSGDAEIDALERSILN